MKKLIPILLLLIGFNSIAQQYRINPTLGTTSNKSYALAQIGPVDYRSWLNDSANFRMRPYISKAEVLYYLYLPKFRAGNFSIWINEGGSLSNGIVTGGRNLEYWFRDNCTADSCLVLKYDTSATGLPNSNIGNGYRVAVDGTNNIKTVFPGYGQLIDSTENDNGITFRPDTAVLFPAIRETITIPSSSSRPFFLVSAYGAIGDGVADDRIAIQNAINAAALVNGIVLFDSVGTYRIGSTTTDNSIKRGLTCATNTTIWIPQGVTVKWGNSIITSGNPAQLFHIPNNTNNVYIGWPNGIGGILDGNTSGQTCVGCYTQTGGNYLIGSATIFNGISIEGLRLTNSFSNVINLGTGNTYGTSQNVKLSHLFAENFGEGVQVIATDNVYANDIIHVMNGSIVVGDALELAFCRYFNISNIISKTSTGANISTGGSGIDLYASRSGIVSNFFISGTVYGFQVETDFGNNTKNPDSIAISNGSLSQINFSPFIFTGGNITVSNVEALDCKQNGPQLSKSTNAAIIPNYRFENIKLSGRCVFYLNDSIKFSGYNLGLHLMQSGVGAFSINSPELDIDGVKIRADSSIAAFFFADNTNPKGRIINIDADSVYNNARNIVLGTGTVINRLTISGSPPLKVLQGLVAPIAGAQVAVISQNVNSSNLPVGSKNQRVTINGIYQASFTNGARLKLLNNSDVTLPTVNDELTLQYGEDDVWREVNRSITSVNNLQSLQGVTNIGATTTNRMSIIDTASGNYNGISGINFFNNLGKAWTIGYGNGSYTLGSNLLFRNNTGTFVAVDSSSNLGLNTSPSVSFHILRSGRDSEIRLQTTSSHNSLISYYTSAAFRGTEGYTASGDRFMYHSASNSYPYYVFTNGRIRFNSTNGAEDGSLYKAQFAGGVHVSDSIWTDLSVFHRSSQKFFGFFPGAESSYTRFGNISNQGIKFIVNNSEIAQLEATGLQLNVVSTGTNTDSVAVFSNGLIKRVLQSSIGGSNFYTADGTFTSNRIVSFGGFSLNFNGNTGFGTSTISARVHSLSTTEQLRLGYDASNYSSFTISSSGVLTISPTGASTLISGGLAFGNANNNMGMPSSVGGSTTTLSQALIGGSSGLVYRIVERGGTPATMTANYSYGTHVIGEAAVTEAGSGTHALLTQLAIKPLNVTAGAATVTDAATLYVEGAGNATVAGFNDAFRVSAGNSRFGGDMYKASASFYSSGQVSMMARNTTTGRIEEVLSSALTGNGNVSLGAGNDYFFTGTTATYTLPALSSNYIGRPFLITIKNRGSGNITVNSNAGGNDIYDTSAVNTMTILPGEARTFIQDSNYWNVE